MSVLDLLKKDHKTNNTNFMVNFGTSNYIDFQIVHPKNFCNETQFGYALYICFYNDKFPSHGEKERLIAKYGGLFKELDDGNSELGCYYYISYSDGDVSRVFSGIWNEVMNYPKRQVIYYDIDEIYEPVK